MATAGTITMRMQELDRLKIIQAVVDGNPKPGQSCNHSGELKTLTIYRRAVSMIEHSAVAAACP